MAVKDSKVFSIDDFKKEIKKSSNLGGTLDKNEFGKIKYYIHSGNYMFNALMTGSLLKGYPGGRIVEDAGEKGCLFPEELVEIVFFKSIEIDRNIFDETGDNYISKEVNYLDKNVILEQLGGLEFNIYCEKNKQQIKVVDLYNNHKKDILYINTPDGFQEIGDLYKKVEKDIYKIYINDFSIRCADSHLVETETGWVFSRDLQIGENVLTKEGFKTVTNIEKLEPSIVYDFEVLHENHRYWAGEGHGISNHNTGKTFKMIAAIVHGLKSNTIDMAVYYDSENAIDPENLKNNYDIDLEKVWYEPVSTIEDLKVSMVNTIERLKEKKRAGFSIPRVLFIIDSLGNLGSKKEFDDALGGDIKVDMTRAKAISSLFRIIPTLIAEIDATVLYTNHVYDDITSFFGGTKGKGGKGREYISSLIVSESKAKGKEGLTKNGVIITSKIKEKNRFAIPGEIQEYISFKTGLDPYMGLPFLIPGVPFKQDYFIDIEKDGWKDFGIQMGQILTEKEFESLKKKFGEKNIKDIQQIFDTEYTLGSDKFYYADREMTKKFALGSVKKIAIKHLGTEVDASQFFTAKVFTLELLEKIDELMIKPRYSYGSKPDETLEDIFDDIIPVEADEDDDETGLIDLTGVIQ